MTGVQTCALPICRENQVFASAGKSVPSFDSWFDHRKSPVFSGLRLRPMTTEKCSFVKRISYIVSKKATEITEREEGDWTLSEGCIIAASSTRSCIRRLASCFLSVFFCVISWLFSRLRVLDLHASIATASCDGETFNDATRVNRESRNIVSESSKKLQHKTVTNAPA